MIVVAAVAMAVLFGVLIANQPANPQTLPPAQTAGTTQTAQAPPAPEDCGCGVPNSPRGPR